MINWAEVKAALSPIRDFEDLSRRWRDAYVYSFVVRHYNLSNLVRRGGPAAPARCVPVGQANDNDKSDN